FTSMNPRFLAVSIRDRRARCGMIEVMLTDAGDDLIINRNVEEESQRDLFPHKDGLQLAADTGHRWTLGNEALLGIYLEPIRAESVEAAYFEFAWMMRRDQEEPALTPAVLRSIWYESS